MKHDRKGFTIVEIMMVVLVIMILAGITVSVTRLAFRKSADARARSDIQRLAVALERYKAQHGHYPIFPQGERNPDGQPWYDITGGSYQRAWLAARRNQWLLQELTNNVPPLISFHSNEIHRVGNQFTLFGSRPQHYTNVFVDPYGVPYDYLCFAESDAEGRKRMRNLDSYDLWSFGPDLETRLGVSSLNKDDITNWRD